MKDSYLYYCKHHIVSTLCCSIALFALSFGHPYFSLSLGFFAAGCWIAEIRNPSRTRMTEGNPYAPNSEEWDEWERENTHFVCMECGEVTADDEGDEDGTAIIVEPKERRTNERDQDDHRSYIVLRVGRVRKGAR